MLEKNSGISKDGGYFFGAICCNLRTWQNFTMSHRPSPVFHTEHPTLCTTQWARHEALCSFSIPCTSSLIPSLPSHLNPATGIWGNLCRSRLSNHLYAFDAKVGALSAQFFGLGGGCLHKVNICDVFCWIGYKTWVFLLLFLPTPRYASAGTSHGPVSVSVCHKSVFYQTAERFSWVLAAEICGFMCCRSLWPAVPGRAVKASVWTGDWPAAHLSTPLRPRTGGSFSLVMFLTLLHSMWSR